MLDLQRPMKCFRRLVFTHTCGPRQATPAAMHRAPRPGVGWSVKAMMAEISFSKRCGRRDALHFRLQPELEEAAPVGLVELRKVDQRYSEAGELRRRLRPAGRRFNHRHCDTPAQIPAARAACAMKLRIPIGHNPNQSENGPHSDAPPRKLRKTGRERNSQRSQYESFGKVGRFLSKF
jgi:hypothetical protein